MAKITIINFGEEINKILCLSILLLCFLSVNSQEKVKQKPKQDSIKTGWNIGFLPIITYNTDLGLQYGALANLYDYGDGKDYPAYHHSIYTEVSAYTKGSGIYRIFYDTKHFIKGIRTTFDISYLPDLALDFYGFNGYQAKFNKDWMDENSESYKTRMFYRHERNILKVKADFQGKTKLNNINWAAGIAFNNTEISTVDTVKLNRGKSGDEILPSVPTLYDEYVEWGLIKKDEKGGGFVKSIKAGLVFDTRDNEPNPMKGIWSEIVVSQSFTNNYNYLRLALTHRQYFTLIENNLSLVYRLGYQGVIAGKAPFYTLPDMIYSYTASSHNNGLGGSKSIRGVVRNRVVGEGNIYGNIEFRWIFTRFRMFNQNIYIALSPFFDFGKIVQHKKIDKSVFNESNVNYTNYFNKSYDAMHYTSGIGLHFAMNQNFIIAVDYGTPFNKQDGDGSLYIGLNFLF